MAETALGRYRLVEQLDRNESTQVFRGHDTVTDREVTVVRLVDDASRQRFFDGARLLASLDDPHVPAVLDIDDEYFVTRPVAGRSLMADGLLSPQRAVAVLEQVGDAVDAAHAVGLVHGEIRPANITVGKRDFAMLTGFAHGSGPSSVGRFAYLAPERFEAGDATVAGDVYALACVLFECLTGRTPYAGDTLEQQITGHLAKPAPRPSDTGVPAAFDAVIATGLAKDPAVRFGSAGALLDAARAALSGMVAPEPVAPPPPAPAPTEPASAAWLGVDAAKVALARPADVPDAAVPVDQVPPDALVAVEPEPPVTSFDPAAPAAAHHVIEPDDSDAPPVSYGWPTSVDAAALPPSPHPQYATPPAAPPQYAVPAVAGTKVRCAHRTLRVHGLSRPEGVAVDGAGTVFIADWGNDRIIAVATGSAPTTLRVPGLDGPAGVALGDGTLFITDSGNNRVVVRQDRAFRAKALPIALLDNPQGIAADPHGWIYIADWGNDRVLAVTADGRDARTLPFPGLVGPQDVAVDGSGAVYVTDAANNRVLQLSPGASAPVELPLTGLKSPHSIAVDRARTVYVTDRGNNRVVLMTADQTQRTLGLDGLAEPSGIAVDARGVIYIVDDGNDRILQATPLP
ncbi:serine/threonine-protein kinase PknD [Mycolicibacterium insubricum]|uniref:Uncharacterized protein n=1 Tax=Mycolicibacterium insubricum TaxID=444597 RepID=A0A1X0DI54_9MYCO|nr:hypothetical protein BST26_07285 [Mycolicibacterium insubricum]BBZ65527.1 serine/threonine-protein kinase PknD [Mycolicibacterium insubricum]